jgi:hypothetical protein
MTQLHGVSSKHHFLEEYRGIRRKAPHIRDLEERVAVFTLGRKIFGTGR